MMTNEPFSVPDSQEFIDNFGVSPTVIDVDAVELDLSEIVGERLRFSFSPAGRSVRLQWTVAKGCGIDVFREGAYRLRISVEEQSVFLVTDFMTESLAGRMRLQVLPSVNLEDELLFR
jgi:hypothetical protein